MCRYLKKKTFRPNAKVMLSINHCVGVMCFTLAISLQVSQPPVWRRNVSATIHTLSNSTEVRKHNTRIVYFIGTCSLCMEGIILLYGFRGTAVKTIQKSHNNHSLNIIRFTPILPLRAL